MNTELPSRLSRRIFYDFLRCFPPSWTTLRMASRLYVRFHSMLTTHRMRIPICTSYVTMIFALSSFIAALQVVVGIARKVKLGRWSASE